MIDSIRSSRYFPWVVGFIAFAVIISLGMAFAFGMTAKARDRDREFRLRCYAQDGRYVEFKNNNYCIIDGVKFTRRGD